MGEELEGKVKEIVKKYEEVVDRSLQCLQPGRLIREAIKCIEEIDEAAGAVHTLRYLFPENQEVKKLFEKVVKAQGIAAGYMSQIKRLVHTETLWWLT